MARRNLLEVGRTVYPFLQGELFLPWDQDSFAARVDATIEVFIREGLLEQVSEDDGGILSRNAGQSDEVFRLRALGHPLQQAFERYYIAISVLAKNGPGTLGAGELESLRSEEHTSELQSLMRISYAVFCLKQKTLN